MPKREDLEAAMRERGYLKPLMPAWWINAPVGMQIVSGGGLGQRAVVIQPWNGVFLGCAKTMLSGHRDFSRHWTPFALREHTLFDEFWLPRENAEEMMSALQEWAKNNDPDQYWEDQP